MAKVFLSLGSNIGDRKQYLDNALAQLSNQLAEINSSHIYKTKPWGVTDQAFFYNICLSAKTTLSPLDLLNFIKDIEETLGRRHSEKWGPREIDIDILFYNDQIITENKLVIPHPGIIERAFVLTPLAEIAADFAHPILNKTIIELANSIDAKGVEKL